jgi:hypothetical protein
VTDAEICAAVAELYAGGAAWDHYWPAIVDRGVECAMRQQGDADLVVFRGSMTLVDWIRDAISELDQPLDGFRAIGDLPLGFGLGMVEVHRALGAVLRPGKRLIATGHSLGAARAAIFAGMMAQSAGSVGDLVLFGCPRPGRQPLKAALSAWSIRSYRNRHDRVCDVPTDPPDSHVAEFIQLEERIDWSALSAIARIEELADPFRDHHIALYLQGVATLEAERSSAGRDCR